MQIIVNIENVFLQVSVVVIHGRNDKQSILSFENLRGIVRQAKVRKLADSVVTDSSVYVVKADSSSKIFQPITALYSFFCHGC